MEISFPLDGKFPFLVQAYSDFDAACNASSFACDYYSVLLHNYDYLVCRMVVCRKALNFTSSRDHGQRYSPSQTSISPRAKLNLHRT